jgi:lauroyl/myristoyl acyltransferase
MVLWLKSAIQKRYYAVCHVALALFHLVRERRQCDASVRFVSDIFNAECGVSRRIVSRGTVNYHLEVAAARHLARCDYAYIDRCLAGIVVRGESNVRRCFDQPGPVVVVSAHMGNPYLALLRLLKYLSAPRRLGIMKRGGQPGREEDIAYAKIRDAAIDLRVLRLDDRPARESYKVLKSNGILVAMIDAVIPLVKSGEVTLFGRKARIACGPSELAIAAGATILPIVSMRGEGGGLEIVVEDPIHTALLLGDADEKLCSLQQRLAGMVEGWIRKSPEQVHDWPAIMDLVK